MIITIDSVFILHLVTWLINLNIISREILGQTDKRVKIESPVMNTEEVEALSKVDGIRVR